LHAFRARKNSRFRDFKFAKNASDARRALALLGMKIASFDIGNLGIVGVVNGEWSLLRRASTPEALLRSI
jgi:hypothetical protein